MPPRRQGRSKKRAPGTSRLLFLLGGGPALEIAADFFVPAAGGPAARIALLIQWSAHWQKYVPGYTEPLLKRGVSQVDAILPDENGQLDVERTRSILGQATGILIGGGHTPTYRHLYADEPARSLIRQRYQEGVPLVGISAGALIMLERCLLDPEETGAERVTLAPGLGLVQDRVIGVHFSECDALPEVLEAMALAGITRAWGIDEPAGVVLAGGAFRGILGQSVYEIEWPDLKAGGHRITLCTTRYGDQSLEETAL